MHGTITHGPQLIELLALARPDHTIPGQGQQPRMLAGAANLDPARSDQLRGQRLTKPARLEQRRIRIRIDVGFGLGAVQDEQRFMVQQEAEVRRPARQLPDPLVYPGLAHNGGSSEYSEILHFPAEGPEQTFAEQPAPLVRRYRKKPTYTYPSCRYRARPVV